MKDLIDHEIRTLGPDEKITEPGFYSISMDRHHNQPCDGISVTSSVLRKMELQTPADAWCYHILNKDRYVQEDTTALRLGRAMAAFIEGGPDGLTSEFQLLPAVKPNRPMETQLANYANGTASDAAMKSINFWRKVDADPRPIITKAEWDLLVAMGTELVRDPAARAALGGLPEITMAWFDEAAQLWCLARPDQTSFSGMLGDYKKISSQGRPVSTRLCDSRITEHGYDMQMAFAAEGFQELTHEWPGQVGLVFQSDKPPHHVILRPVEDDDLRMGMFRNQRARLRFRACFDSGVWPGPGEHVGSYRRPDWQKERLIEEMAAAGFSY